MPPSKTDFSDLNLVSPFSKDKSSQYKINCLFKFLIKLSSFGRLSKSSLLISINDNLFLLLLIIEKKIDFIREDFPAPFAPHKSALLAW